MHIKIITVREFFENAMKDEKYTIHDLIRAGMIDKVVVENDKVWGVKYEKDFFEIQREHKQRELEEFLGCNVVIHSDNNKEERKDDKSFNIEKREQLHITCDACDRSLLLSEKVAFIEMGMECDVIICSKCIKKANEELQFI